MSDTEEAKVNADVPIPSDTEIRKEMEVLMRTVNIETMSVKQLIATLSEKFNGADLSSKKKFIKANITPIIDAMQDNDDESSEEDSSGELMRRQNERHQLKKHILEQQVQDIREVIARMDSGDYTPATLTRLKHLLLLEECNGLWDIIPISKAITYLHEHPPPLGCDSEEDMHAYQEAIPFDVGSDEWCFTVLILLKPVPYMSLSSGWNCTTYCSNIYDYDDSEPRRLLAKDQSAKDALIENGFVCGQCLKISPANRCSKCKILKYCSKECQASHWEVHKKQCRKDRLKPSTEHERSTRKRWVEENGSAVLFVRNHCYPRYQDMTRYTGTIPSFYTESVHNTLFRPVYNKVGTNTYTVYGKELGETLFRDHGGIETLREAVSIIPLVIQNLTTNDHESENQLIAEVLARRILSSSWDGIGGWMS